MDRISLFGSSDPKDSVNVLGMFAEIRGLNTRDKEKGLGLDFVGLTDSGSSVYGLVDHVSLADYTMDNGFTLNEEVLFFLFSTMLYENPEGVELATFYVTDDGYVGMDTRIVSHDNRKDSKGLRRFLFIEIDGQFYLSDVYGLSPATIHHKNNRERSDLGLQWENYISIIKNGVAFIR